MQANNPLSTKIFTDLAPNAGDAALKAFLLDRHLHRAPAFGQTDRGKVVLSFPPHPHTTNESLLQPLLRKASMCTESEKLLLQEYALAVAEDDRKSLLVSAPKGFVLFERTHRKGNDDKADTTSVSYLIVLYPNNSK